MPSGTMPVIWCNFRKRNVLLILIAISTSLFEVLIYDCRCFVILNANIVNHQFLKLNIMIHILINKIK